ncbi:ArsB/NhaD family transporter [Iamia sp.]|uniref:ArsB/NhaD family transporter n=1 Tax=Iamia sp. TaxID=2722710 RepID=UPI002CD430E8|nr:ArsB/NhaD family transporter [Iamia sp.]HXH58771.1 ArsB/NhaD family transporter [Iamia sp.]
MTVAALVLLAVGITGAVVQLRRPVLVVVPLGAAAFALAAGLVDVGATRAVLDDLVEPLAFLLTAVPLAVLLDELGVFEAVARRLPVRWLAPGLWVIGAATVTLVNLDAAVVLLTPVAIRGARRAGLDPMGLALQPALLASLASSTLPVSNLTNLIAEQRDPRGPGAYLVTLGPPTLAALVVGYGLWWVWWRPVPQRVAMVVVAVGAPGPLIGPSACAEQADVGDGSVAVADREALVIGALVGGVLLVGFTVGDALGAPPWLVATVVLLGLALRAQRLPLAAVPWTSALTVIGLAVLAVAAAEQVDLGAVLGPGDGALATARIVGVGAIAANLTNNLPAFLAGLPALPDGDRARWAWLLGVNAGPTVLVTGSLAGMLWLDVARRNGLDVTWRHFLSAGGRVGVPALVAATAVLALLGP